MLLQWKVAPIAAGLVLIACIVPLDRSSAADSAGDRISAERLRAHVEFLASDQLRGRGNGTPGLEAAAEYIAAEFKKAGLRPAGTDGYFQPARMTLIEPDKNDFAMSFSGNGPEMRVALDEVLLLLDGGLDLKDVPTVKIDPSDLAATSAIKREDVEGKVVLLKIVVGTPRPEDIGSSARINAALPGMHPALILNYGPGAAKVEVPGRIEMLGATPRPSDVPRFPVRTDALRAYLETQPTGLTPLRLSIHIRPSIRKPIVLRNVAGVLPGSEKDAADTYLIVTAVYDGAYTRRGDPDPILNGANANASGVASLLEAASALAQQKPRHSILFVTLFGAEVGGLGATHLSEHPLVPVEKTVGCVNLSHLGRTDLAEGTRTRAISITSVQASKIPGIFESAGKESGIRVDADTNRQTLMTGRGFKPILVDQGVPSHTVYVALTFPGLHTFADKADKIDYKNMTEVDRMIANALLATANTRGVLK